MDFEEAYKVADDAAFANRAKRLTDAEATVLRGAWQNQPYEEIAARSQYSLNYLKRDVGPKLWRMLSDALNEEVGKTNFREALERQKLSLQQISPLPEINPRLKSHPSSTANPRRLKKDWGESFDVSVSFYGRTEELAKLETWILSDHCRMVGIFGVGGVGKTSLATKLADRIKDQFEYFIWRSLRHIPPIEDILADLIDFLDIQLDSNLTEDPHAALSSLLEYLRYHRCLIILDSAEVLMRAGDRAGRYSAGLEAYGDLFTRIGREFHKSCLILTSREKPKEFTAYEGDALLVRSLQLEGLDLASARELLQDKGLPEPADQYQELIQKYAGNPFAIQIAATAIKNLFNNSIASFLAAKTLVFDSIRLLLEKQVERLSESETKIIYWLAICREWVSLAALRKLIISPMLQAKLLEALYALGRRSLVEKSDKGFTLQPMLMEYVTAQLIEQIRQEIRSEKLDLMNSHALLQAKAEDYVQELQVNCILRPLIDRLLLDLDNNDQIKTRLLGILFHWRDQYSLKPGYLGSNILNLLQEMQVDLSYINFSHLALQQTDFQGAVLQAVDFTSSDLANCTFTETLGTVWSIAFHPVKRWLAIGDDNGQISVWDAEEDQMLTVLTGHNSWIRSVTFSPQGDWLASGSQDLTIRLWQVETGCHQILVDPDLGNDRSHKDWVRCIQFSPDNQFLASSSDDFTVKLWDVPSGERLRVFHCEDRVRSISFSADGLILASCSDDHIIRLWDVETGECWKTLAQHQGWVRSVAFSPNGRRIASCSDDRTVKLWDAYTGDHLRTFNEHQGWVRSVAFSPDSHLLASCSDDRTIKLWDVETGACLKTLEQHEAMVLAVAFSREGEILASGGDDQTVRLWEVQTGHCLRTIQGHTTGVRSIAFSPDGQSLASGGNDQTVKLWNLDNGTFKVLTEHTGRVWSVAYSPNGQYLASGGDDRIIRCLNLALGELVPLMGHSHYVRALSFSPDSTLLASSSYDKTIRLWDARTGHCIRVFEGNEHWVRTIAFSPDGRWLGSGNDSQLVSLWDVATASRYIFGKHEHRVRTVAFSPDGRLLASGSDDHLIKVWNVKTREELKVLSGHQGGVQSLCFIDGHTLVSGSDDRTIKLWDLETADCLNTLTGHENWVRSISLSSDKSLLASGGNDRLIRIWSLPTGECTRALKIKSPYESMNITHAKGLTLSQRTTLLNLGAVDLEAIDLGNLR